ncbi:MAG: hypothetical protein Ct9H300mP28_09890 [Pseudomonadota bacterium]|nr:MAG: hypothetical protein Ct9H300mP28_09890 [Pseudomonadota bacterium]
MIEIRGPNVFKGYWGMPEKTAEELRENGFFITGDLGTIGKRICFSCGQIERFNNFRRI